MSCISWNARELGNQRSFRELKRLIAEKSLSLLFICETRKRDFNAQLGRMHFGYSGCFVVSSQGKSSGLILFWNDTLNVSIQSYFVGHIDCIVIDQGKRWRFTGFYGNPNANLRHHSWSLLPRLHNITELKDLSWLVGGDFNEICFDNEKLGGNLRPFSQMQAFRDVLDNCALQDLHCEGDRFTWVNRRSHDQIIFERLDRFVGNFQWRLLYPTAVISSLEFYHSDHRPILIQLQRSPAENHSLLASLKRPFRFEACWLFESDCGQSVLEGWTKYDSFLSLPDRISQCVQKLKQWARTKVRLVPAHVYIGA